MKRISTRQAIKYTRDNLQSVMSTLGKNNIDPKYTKEMCFAMAQLESCEEEHKKVVREIKEIVSSEEELPGDMPDSVWGEMQDRAGAEIVLRAVVISTKKNIIKKIKQKYEVSDG